MTLGFLGGRVDTVKPLALLDGSAVLVAVFNTLRAYHPASGELLYELQGHGVEVHTLCHHPSNEDIVYSSSTKEIIAWDLAAPAGVPALVDRWNLSECQEASPLVFGGADSLKKFEYRIETVSMLPGAMCLAAITKVAVGKGADTRPSALVTPTAEGYPADKERSGRLYVLNLKLKRFFENKHIQRISRMGVMSAERSPGHAGGPPYVRFALSDKNSLHVGRSDAYPTAGVDTTLTHTRNYTVSAVEPRSCRIAVGDVSGRILIYTPPPADPTGPMAPVAAQSYALTTRHWHAHPVTALCFSRDGVYLLSGGHEETLVIWQVADGKRSYLPRLGGPIRHITPVPEDPARYLVALGCNAVLRVNVATMQVESRISGLYPVASAAVAHPLRLSGHLAHWAPASASPAGALVALPGDKNRVQLTDWAHGRTVGMVQVGPRPVVSAKDPQALTMEGGVLGLCVGGSSGEHLVTISATAVEATGFLRKSSEFPGVDRPLSLRFWRRADTGRDGSGLVPRFDPVTSVDGAHGGDITCLTFSPPGPSGSAARPLLCVTTSTDGRFKVWRQAGGGKREGDPAGKERPQGWALSAAGSYLGEPLTSCAFSLDGSVLYIGSAGGVISIWDPLTNSLLSAAAHPSGLPVTHLEPASGGSGGPAAEIVLATLADTGIVAFDPARGAFSWGTDLSGEAWRVKAMTRDPVGGPAAGEGAGKAAAAAAKAPIRLALSGPKRGPLASPAVVVAMDAATGRLAPEGHYALPMGHEAVAVLPLPPRRGTEPSGPADLLVITASGELACSRRLPQEAPETPAAAQQPQPAKSRRQRKGHNQQQQNQQQQQQQQQQVGASRAAAAGARTDVGDALSLLAGQASFAGRPVADLATDLLRLLMSNSYYKLS